MNSRKEGRLY